MHVIWETLSMTGISSETNSCTMLSLHDHSQPCSVWSPSLLHTLSSLPGMLCTGQKHITSAIILLSNLVICLIIWPVHTWHCRCGQLSFQSSLGSTQHQPVQLEVYEPVPVHGFIIHWVPITCLNYGLTETVSILSWEDIYCRVHVGGYGQIHASEWLRWLWRTKESDFESVAYMFQLVFLVPHLNLNLDYHVEVFRHLLSQFQLLEILPNALSGFLNPSRPGATHSHLVPFV